MQYKKKHIANFISLGICAIIFLIVSLLNESDDLIANYLILVFSAVFIFLIHLLEFFHIRTCKDGKEGSLALLITKFVFVFLSFNATIALLATQSERTVSSWLLFAGAIFASIGYYLILLLISSDRKLGL